MPVSRKNLSPLAFVSSILVLGAMASAQEVTISKIIDTATSVPGGPSSWNSFGFPAVSGNLVTFQGFERGGANRTIVYTVPVSGGAFTVIAQSGDAIPNRPGETFAAFANPTLAGSTAVFAGGHGSHETFRGVYSGAGGPLDLIVDNTTAPLLIPVLSVAGSLGVVFRDEGYSGEPIGFSTLDGQFQWIARQGDPRPEGGTFFNLDLPSLAGNLVAFEADNGRSIYTHNLTTGQKRLIANDHTAQPGGMGNFIVTHRVDTDGANVVFDGWGGSFPNYRFGVYLFNGISIETIADIDTTVPGGAASFDSLGSDVPGVDAGNVVFDASYGTVSGVYARWNGQLIKIAETSDLLDGKTPLGFTINRRCISGNHIVFLTEFTDGSRGVFAATIGGGNGPSLSVSGNCPGTMTLTVNGATPGSNVAFIYAFGAGHVVVPPGPCAGTPLGLNQTATLLRTVRADGNGTAIAQGFAPPAACGRVVVQALDLSACKTTNVAGL